MRKSVLIVISAFVTLIIVLNVFAGNIGPAIAKILYKDNSSEYQITETVETITLKKNNYIYFGKFNGENILWKVISVDEDGVPTLLAEKIICFLPFNSSVELKPQSSNWVTSDIRRWLNSTENKDFIFRCTAENRIRNNTINISGGFLCENNFSDSEISIIKDEVDKIFLPSKSLLENLKPEQRVKAPTVQAVTNNTSRYLQFRTYCWYWTQDPISTNTSSVTTVTSSGNFYKSISTDALTGVCPATRYKTNIINVRGGDGTFKTPFIFDSEVMK